MKIDERDIRQIEMIAARYGCGVADLCKAISAQLRSRIARQFRVSVPEYDELVRKSKSRGMSISRYCEHACQAWLAGEINGSFYEHSIYGDNRTERISVSFSDAETEEGILAAADNLNIKIGALIRFCALEY